MLIYQTAIVVTNCYPHKSQLPHTHTIATRFQVEAHEHNPKDAGFLVCNGLLWSGLVWLGLVWVGFVSHAGTAAFSMSPAFDNFSVNSAEIYTRQKIRLIQTRKSFKSFQIT